MQNGEASFIVMLDAGGRHHPSSQIVGSDFKIDTSSTSIRTTKFMIQRTFINLPGQPLGLPIHARMNTYRNSRNATRQPTPPR